MQFDEIGSDDFEPVFEKRGNQPAAGPVQVSLFEMFFLTTLAAVALGLYIYVSSLLAMTLGSGLIVAGVVKWSAIQNLILGGLVGFVTAAIMVVVISVCLQTDLATTIGLALLGPAAGYIGGCCMAELSNNDML